MKRDPRSGITLIELLIAVSLVGILSTGVLLSLNVGFTSMEKANAKVIGNRRNISVQRILQSQLAGLIPGYIDCPQGFSGGWGRVTFFDGRPQSMRLISSYSLAEASRGYPRILEYKVIPGERGRGVRLVVNEILYTGPREAGPLCAGTAFDAAGQAVAQYREVATGPGSFVLADRLADCRFLYRQTDPNIEGGSRWLPEWQFAGWPTGVRVEMSPLEPDPSRVPLLGVTAPIRISKAFNVRYTD